MMRPKRGGDDHSGFACTARIRRRDLNRLLAAAVFCALTADTPPASATIFDDIGEGLLVVTGLRGVVRGIGRGAAEGISDQLNRFVDDKIDPLISRVNQIVKDRIEQATQAALVAIRAAQNALTEIIDRAATRIKELTARFFAELDATLAAAIERLEVLLDDTLCRLMPDGRIQVNLGPFDGSDQVKVKTPKRTHCYRDFPGAQGDPASATFRRWEFFRGELCETELQVNRIDPTQPESIKRTIAGYDKLTEMARSARCAAPTASAKVEMARKVHLYEGRAAFFRSLQRGAAQ